MVGVQVFTLDLGFGLSLLFVWAKELGQVRVHCGLKV